MEMMTRSFEESAEDGVTEAAAVPREAPRHRKDPRADSPVAIRFPLSEVQQSR